MVSGPQTATLAGGCFWCLEAIFTELRGIQKVESGYSGGWKVDPTYRQVCDGDTGHAEVVQLTFDQDQITFSEVLKVFFTIHDPTTLNRQGADVGSQYRSAIFYHTPEQEQVARVIISALNHQGIWNDPIVTEVTPFQEFYPAGAYHQDYFAIHSGQPYCQLVVAPKVAKFRKQFMDKLRSQP